MGIYFGRGKLGEAGGEKGKKEMGQWRCRTEARERWMLEPNGGKRERGTKERGRMAKEDEKGIG